MFHFGCFCLLGLISITSAGVVGICDQDCPVGQICVIEEVYCIRAPCPRMERCVDRVRPGSCPAPVQGLVGACVVNCFGDYSCPEGQKCCGNCPKSCVSINEKPGRCPPQGPYGHCYIYRDQCDSDSQCSGSNKCCPSLCGKRCRRPFPF